jgi:hypothetical protein
MPAKRTVNEKTGPRGSLAGLFYAPNINNYSVFKLFTGLTAAAFTDWKLMVINPLTSATITEKHFPSYRDPVGKILQPFMAIQATGKAMIVEINTSFRKP